MKKRILVFLILIAQVLSTFTGCDFIYRKNREKYADLPYMKYDEHGHLIYNGIEYEYAFGPFYNDCGIIFENGHEILKFESWFGFLQTARGYGIEDFGEYVFIDTGSLYGREKYIKVGFEFFYMMEKIDYITIRDPFDYTDETKIIDIFSNNNLSLKDIVTLDEGVDWYDLTETIGYADFHFLNYSTYVNSMIRCWESEWYINVYDIGSYYYTCYRINDEYKSYFEDAILQFEINKSGE